MTRFSLSLLIVFTLAVLLAAGCDPEDGEVGDLQGTSTEVEVCAQDSIDDYVIEQLSVTGDMLTVSLSYGGGCEEHEYLLCWDGDLHETNPVQARLTLIHDANGDDCEAEVHDEPCFDLSLLKDAYENKYMADFGTIVLRLDDTGTEYHF